MNPAPVITLDGPGGAGKGTLAGMLSRRLGWALLDSGALYRLVGLLAMRNRWDCTDANHRAQAVESAMTLDLLFSQDAGEAGQRVLLAGEDVSAAIRDSQVSNAASKWAAQPAIRAALLARQRAFVAAPGLIADGRDMGTVVFPQAELKLFVTASAEERARRRFAQLSERGVTANLDRIYREIADRDARDASRDAAPLKPAADAKIIDTTGESVADSCARLLEIVTQKGWL